MTDRSASVDLDPALRAEAGFGPPGSPPDAGWTWIDALGTPGWDDAAQGDEGEDEYQARLRVPAPGDHDLAFRFSRDGGSTWTTCDLDGDDFDRPGRLRSLESPCQVEPCEAPPAALCTDELTRTTWQGPGTCRVVDGAAICDYEAMDTDCSDLGGACVGGRCLGAYAIAGAGEVVFTEVLYDAAGPLDDATAEWFEVQSVADGPRTLHGCRLEDTAHVNVLDRVLLEPGQILLFARSDDPDVNGGLRPDVLFDFGLGNSGETLTIRCGEVLVDRLTWDASFPTARKASIALDPGATDAALNDDGARWCLGRSPYFVAPPNDDHRGTPGEPNPPCDAESCEPNPCVFAPPDACADEQTVRRYAPVGACALPEEGLQCRYTPELEICPAGRACRRGACVLPDRQPPLPGEVVITEIMPDPEHGLNDDDAEWFELYNSTDGRITLDGCEVEDAGGATEPISGLFVEPRGYVLFARSLDSRINGGLRADAAFGFRLGGDGDRLTLRCGQSVIDRVDYTGFRTAAARAVSLDPAFVDGVANDDGAHWCLARQAYDRHPDGNNLGTPRSPNPPCAVPVDACALVDAEALEGPPFAILAGFVEAQVIGVTDRTPRNDPSPDLLGQLGLSRDAELPRWISAAPALGWDADAAGSPGFDRYRAEIVVPPAGEWLVSARFSADGGFSWATCAGVGTVTTREDEVCAGDGCAGTQPGEVMITELMYDPQFALDDANAEWIEIVNASIRAVDLAGCVLGDAPDAALALMVGDVRLEPGDLALFARSADPALNGGLNPDQTFAFGLANEGDTVVLVCEGVEIDRVTYDDGADFPDASAASISLDPEALVPGTLDPTANDAGDRWCLGRERYFVDPIGADRDHVGTPGAPNPACD